MCRIINKLLIFLFSILFNCCSLPIPMSQKEACYNDLEIETDRSYFCSSVYVYQSWLGNNIGNLDSKAISDVNSLINVTLLECLREVRKELKCKKESGIMPTIWFTPEQHP